MPRIALAGPSSLVTEAGALVAGSGGSIVDVVVAAALTATCVDPGVCAPGSGGYLTIDLSDAGAVVIDGYMNFPGIGFAGKSSSREVTMGYGGGVTTLVGPGSVGVPGAFAAFEMASERYGVMPWAEVVELVAGLVDRGFPMSQPAHMYFLEGAQTIFDDDVASRNALFPEGVIPPPGSPIHFDDLADSLRLIGSEGSRVFYEGELGRAIVDDLATRGGRITMEDLRAYRAWPRDPLALEIDSWGLLTNPAPAVGGAAMIVALERIGAAADPNSHTVWLAALREAFQKGSRHLEGVDGDYQTAVSAMLREAGLHSPSTVAVAGVDEEGSAVSASFSAGYGSGVVPKGTGMLMNNSVGEIQLLPGGIEAQVPGQRMLSNMAPTVARTRDRVVGIASPGATRITSALAITLSRLLFGGDELVAAIDHPRLHPEGDGFDGVAAESGLELPDLDVRWYPDLHMYFGGVVGAALNQGRLTAYADQRRLGDAVVLD